MSTTVRITSLGKKLILLAGLITFLLGTYLFVAPTPLTLRGARLGRCSPGDYADGSWVAKGSPSALGHSNGLGHSKALDLPIRNMSSPEDALAFSGFSGCASSREVWWHLAADNEGQYDRFPAAHSWEWREGEGCVGLRPVEREEVVRTLVEEGGWYLVGDSVTENHFFSLSCTLHPHVVASPDYSGGGAWDRGWPQHLRLSPSSPLVRSLRFPPGFDIATTPLVSFRRVDVLFGKEELEGMYAAMQREEGAENTTLFSDEAVWTIPPSDYTAEFLSANYATMIVSTGGHWTTTLFSGAGAEGIDGVLALFERAVDVWLGIVQSALSASERSKGLSRFGLGTKRRRRVVVRPYTPGHESCHEERRPWVEVKPFVWGWYNWAEIGRFNEVFEKRVADRKVYPDVHYLGIDRPARLRPDAHTTGDCLHIMTGAGVLEGWTRYIWHYVTREV